MSPNSAFWRAAHSIAHPLTALMIVLLLINDHWLRHTAPSWATGKLGDVAWLAFAPLIAALAFAWIVPPSWKHQERLVAWLSFGFIGLWFATAKTIPAVNEITNTSLSRIVGWQTNIRLDPTDLLTLPALLIGIYCWRKASNVPQRLLPREFALFGLAILGTLANSFAIDYGIVRLCADSSGIYAEAGMDGELRYQSLDGGVTWKTADREAAQSCFLTYFVNMGVNGNREYVKNDPLQRYFIEGRGIYQPFENRDVKTFDSTYLNTGKQRLFHNGNYLFIPSLGDTFLVGPLDAVFDPRTGHLVVAMGLLGVGIQTMDGEWRWVTVGDYRYDIPDTLEDYASVIPYPVIGACLMLIYSLFILNRKEFSPFIKNLNFPLWPPKFLNIVQLVLFLSIEGFLSFLWLLIPALSIAMMLFLDISSVYVISILSVAAISFGLAPMKGRRIHLLFRLTVILVLYAIPFLLYVMDVLPFLFPMLALSVLFAFCGLVTFRIYDWRSAAQEKAVVNM